MVRSRFCLELIERDNLVQNAAQRGEQLLHGLHQIAADEPMISAVRGRGLLIAFDLPDKEQREEFYHGLYERGVLAIRCGDRSIRFRPALDIDSEVIEASLKKIREQCRSMRVEKMPGERIPSPSARENVRVRGRAASAKK